MDAVGAVVLVTVGVLITAVGVVTVGVLTVGVCSNSPLESVGCIKPPSRAVVDVLLAVAAPPLLEFPALVDAVLDAPVSVLAAVVPSVPVPAWANGAHHRPYACVGDMHDAHAFQAGCQARGLPHVPAHEGQPMREIVTDYCSQLQHGRSGLACSSQWRSRCGAGCVLCK